MTNLYNFSKEYYIPDSYKASNNWPIQDSETVLFFPLMTPYDLYVSDRTQSSTSLQFFYWFCKNSHYPRDCSFLQSGDINHVFYLGKETIPGRTNNWYAGEVYHNRPLPILNKVNTFPHFHERFLPIYNLHKQQWEPEIIEAHYFLNDPKFIVWRR